MRASVRGPRQRLTASNITDAKCSHVSSSDARCSVACRRTRLLLTVSVPVLLVLAAVQLAVTVWYQPTQNLTCPMPVVPRQLPCQALPLGFLEQHPACANALLDAMNITNVRVLTYDETFGDSGLPESGADVGIPRESDQSPVSVAAAAPDVGARGFP